MTQDEYRRRLPWVLQRVASALLDNSENRVALRRAKNHATALLQCLENAETAA